MATLPSRDRLAFLYRSDQGRIDRATWLRGAALLVGALVPLTLVWLALEPYAAHDLSKTPFFAPMTILAYSYVLIYALAVLLVAISWVNLSAKRFRDRTWPAPLGLASLAPFAALIDGAARVLQPRVAEVMPRWSVTVCDVAVVIILGWTVFELGWREERDH